MDKFKLKEKIGLNSTIIQREGKSIMVIDLNTLFPSIDQLDEPEKVVVPAFVGEFIADNPQYNLKGLYSVIEKERIYSKLFAWLNVGADGRGNADLLARAYLNGYTVEEKKYYVKEPTTGQFLIKDNQQSNGVKWVDGFSSNPESYTEKEIKDIDERFWSFALAIEEEKE